MNHNIISEKKLFARLLVLHVHISVKAQMTSSREGVQISKFPSLTPEQAHSYIAFRFSWKLLVLGNFVWSPTEDTVWLKYGTLGYSRE